MWITTVTAVLLIWEYLPELTIGLKFGTALIGFVLSVSLLRRRVQRWFSWRKRQRS